MVLNICCSIRPQLLSGGKLDCKELDYDCNDPELHRRDDKIEQISARGDSYNSCLSAAGLDRCSILQFHSCQPLLNMFLSGFLIIWAVSSVRNLTYVGRNCRYAPGLLNPMEDPTTLEQPQPTP